MGHLIRQNRVIVATGGSCPSLERLSNGDLLVAYRDDTQPWSCISLTRSTDCGNTWCKEQTFTQGVGPGDESPFYGHHGMTQLGDGTILLPYMVNFNKTGAMVMLRKSTDKGDTWTDPIQVIPGPGVADGWYWAVSYGKIGQLQDGSIILPITSRKRGERFGRNARDCRRRYARCAGRALPGIGGSLGGDLPSQPRRAAQPATTTHWRRTDDSASQPTGVVLSGRIAQASGRADPAMSAGTRLCLNGAAANSADNRLCLLIPTAE